MEVSLIKQIQKNKLTDIRHKKLLSSKSSEEEIYQLMKNDAPGGWPEGFHTWSCTQKAMLRIFRERAEKIKDFVYPENRFSGRGIVICGGGKKYFPSLYVNARMIRLLGCQLPIEIYYIGEQEMDPHMVNILESIENVKCIDATSFEKEYPIRIHAGWESKIYSIIHCSFEEVLFLDADNTPLVDPTFLFDDKKYQKAGAIFWPDAPNWTPHDKTIWEDILGLKYRNEPQIESGQVLINKKKCWKEINISKIYCDYSDYYWRVYYGDKEAFHFGWRYFDNSNYVLAPQPAWINGSVFVHKYLDSSWLFAHRVQAKFKMDKSHRIAYELPYEKDTLELIDELNIVWNNKIWENKGNSLEEFDIINSIIDKRYAYVRVGMDRRDMIFDIDNKIGLGTDRLERNWYIFKDKSGVIKMSIIGDEGLTCLLTMGEDRIFRGRWINHERCAIEVVPYE